MSDATDDRVQQFHRYPGECLCYWHCTKASLDRYFELTSRLVDLREGDDEWFEVVDSIRSLPNFPRDFGPTSGTLVPVITSVTH